MHNSKSVCMNLRETFSSIALFFFKCLSILMFPTSKSLKMKKDLAWPLLLSYATSSNSFINLWKMFINSDTIALVTCPVSVLLMTVLMMVSSLLYALNIICSIFCCPGLKIRKYYLLLIVQTIPCTTPPPPSWLGGSACKPALSRGASGLWTPPPWTQPEMTFRTAAGCGFLVNTFFSLSPVYFSPEVNSGEKSLQTWDNWIIVSLLSYLKFP